MKSSTVSTLLNRNFISLWTVNLATTLAIELFAITVMVAVFAQTGSVMQATGAMVARTIPGIILGPFAGVLVDRVSRKYLLIGMDLVRALLVGLSLLVLDDSDNVPIVGMYIIVLILFSADVVHRPARLALIPYLVPTQNLVNANGSILVVTMIMMAVAFGLGGWLILVVPLTQIVIGVMGLLISAIVFAACINVSEKSEDSSTDDEGVLQAIISGWTYIWRHPLAQPLTVMETLEHFPHGIWSGAFLLVFVTQILPGDAADWGILNSTYFGAMILGSFCAFRISHRIGRHPGWIIIVTSFLAGLFTLAFSASQAVWVAIFIAALFGPPFAIRDIAQDSLLQATVSGRQLGRVYATRETLRNTMFVLAALFLAWILEFIPIRFIYIMGGVLYLLTSMYALSNKSLRGSKMPDTTPD